MNLMRNNLILLIALLLNACGKLDSPQGAALSGMNFDDSSLTLEIGQPVKITASIDKGSPLSCEVANPPLPAGLTLVANKDNCELSGTPTEFTNSQSYTIIAKNAVSSTSVTIQISTAVNSVLSGFSSNHTCLKSPQDEVRCKGGDSLLYPNVLVKSNASVKTLNHVTKLFNSPYGVTQCVLLDSNEPRCWGYLGGNFGAGLSAFSYETLATPVMNALGTAHIGTVVSASNGTNFTCFATTDGYAYCSGTNTKGQLGNGTLISSLFPVQVLNPAGTAPLTDVVEVTTGTAFACARTSGGRLYCWGDNSTMQLNRVNTTPASSALPLEIDSNTNWISISAGYQHVCAINSPNGNVYCWGRNDGGQQGGVWVGCCGARNGMTVIKDTTGGASTKLSGIIKVYGGVYHSCALASSGIVYCWGASTVGQLGRNSMSGTQYYPNTVLRPSGSGILSGVTSLASGNKHTCALSSVDGLVCWGENTYGQLGDNTQTNRAIPVVVKDSTGTSPLTGVTEVATSLYNTCVLISGSVHCWGNDFYGQAGQGSALGLTSYKVTPGPVKTWDNLEALSGPVSDLILSEGPSCILKNDGLTCLGFGGYGQLGNGSFNSQAVPVQTKNSAGTAALSGITKVKAALYHVCALLNDGTVNCWGRNNYGQLGDGTLVDKSLPTPVKQSSGTGTLSNIIDISVGLYHTCALNNSNRVYCWGYNGYGSLGDNTTTNRSLPVNVLKMSDLSSLSGITSIQSGSYSTCGIGPSGNVYCWGYNISGQIGDGTVVQKASATLVLQNTTPITSITSLSLGYSHACAVKEDKTVLCWGLNSNGQLGDGTTTNRSTATVVVNQNGVNSLENILHLSLGKNHSCAVNSQNQTLCWGANNNAQFDDTSLASRSIPELLSF